VIQVAAGRDEDREPIPVEFAQVHPVYEREPSDASGVDHATVSAPEDELTALEVAAGEHAIPFASSGMDLNV
jgi:hypothetical protein